MKSIVFFLINTNIWVAFCVLSLAISSEILLSTTNFKISLFVFFSTILTYNFQRIVGYGKPYNTCVERNKKSIYFLMFIAGLACLHLFVGLKSQTQLIILFLAVISVLYPFVLRRIPFAKIFIISFVWSVSAMILLVIENAAIIDKNTFCQFMSLFLFIFSITIPFDIRDVKYDANKIITIPLFFGVEKSKNIAFFALLICGIISFFQYSETALNLPNLLALILLYVLAFFFIQKSDKKNRKIYFSFWVESLSVFSCFFLVISELIF